MRTRRSRKGGNIDGWYKIPEIKFVDYVRCLKPLYAKLEIGPPAETKENDMFLTSILSGVGRLSLEQVKHIDVLSHFKRMLSMKIGDFHEELMGKFPGYETLPQAHSTGVDVRKQDETEYFEVKNRFNTMNAGSAVTVLAHLAKLHEQGKQTYLIMVNPDGNKPLPRFKAPSYVQIFNGKQAYAFFSGRDTFYADLLTTLAETFKRYPSYSDLERSVSPSP